MTKSFKISKKEIYECYKAVKSNKGSAGIDGKSMEDFEKDLKNNLYRIWKALLQIFKTPLRLSTNKIILTNHN